MSEIITVPQERTPDTVATEIRTLQKAAQKMAVSYAIEIGRKLTEAKGMISHGEWGTWLEEEVSYSKSTANNLMRLYQEYGSDQIDMFADPAKRQALENLSYTQALLLLAVPAEERAEFADANDVANKSTRELEALIKERDEALAAKQAAEEKSQRLEKSSQEDQQDILKHLKKEQKEKEEAEQKAQTMKQQADQAEEKLKKAKADLWDAKKKLQDLKDNPVIPEDTMAKLRKEAEEAATKKATEELEAKQAKLQAEADQAAARAKAAEEARAQAEKKLALANEDLTRFNMIFEQVQGDFNRAHGLLLKIEAANPELAGKLRKATEAVLTSMLARTRGE